MKYLIIIFLVLSSCSDGGYCKDDRYLNAQKFLDLTPFALCGNLYRFNSGIVKIQIDSDIYQKSMIAIEEWNNVLEDIFLVPGKSNYSISVGNLPEHIEGRTYFNVVKNEEDIFNITSYSDFELKNQYWIDSIKILISPTAEVKTIIHEIGHMLGIYGHSQDKNDIMSQNSDATELSPRDIRTIKYVYFHEYDLKIIK